MSYTASQCNWKRSKALGFSLNFVINHDDEVVDSDVFRLVASLQSKFQWICSIQKAIPAEYLKLMKEDSDCVRRLDYSDESQEIIRKVWDTRFARSYVLRILRKVVAKELKAHPIEKHDSELYARKTQELQKTLKLTDMELDVLLVLAFLCDCFLCTPGRRHLFGHDMMDFIAKCLDCDIAMVRDALKDDRKICRYKCVDEELCLNRDILNFLNGTTGEPLTNMYYTRCQDEVLPWEFYKNLTVKHGELLKRILSSGNQDTPTHILFYGVPGTGKTSFARTLAAELKRDCYLISQCSGGFGPVRGMPESRFGALRICAEQVDPAISIIVVDEADRMLRGNDSLPFLSGGGPFGDKGLLNSTLDSVRVPTIWIANTPAEMLDESSRRRFNYSIRFETLDTAQRAAIWGNNIAKMGMGDLIDDSMKLKFAGLYPVSAGGITLALENLAKVSPGKDEVESLVARLMAPHCELLGIPLDDDKLLPAKDYSIEGLNIKGSIPLDRVVAAIRNFQQGAAGGIDRPRMNLLLSGAPGTGKTEFVKYLGSELHTRVVVKMGSDLLNMYVGGTEQNISRAFSEVESEKAILFLDEIDGMVQGRERATRSWEVTQVNELLHQMENFNGIMIGATNLAANLDPAILRRFTFKLVFDYLDEAGKKLFFERMFRTTLTPEESRALAQIPMLAPGDFRTVRQSFFYLGDQVSNRDYINALARESEAKKANAFAPKSKIGF